MRRRSTLSISYLDNAGKCLLVRRARGEPFVCSLAAASLEDALGFASRSCERLLHKIETICGRTSISAVGQHRRRIDAKPRDHALSAAASFWNRPPEFSRTPAWKYDIGIYWDNSMQIESYKVL